MGSSRLTSRRRTDQGSKQARIAIAVLATAGVIDTGSITLNRWGWLGALSCPGGAEGCDKVLNSAWGTISQVGEIAIPLSFLGVLSYITVVGMAVLPLLPGLSENKSDLSRKTWWGLFTISCCMAVFSIILLGLMVSKIQAFCLFCILSAFISLTIFLVTVFGGGWTDPGKVIFRGILLSLGIFMGGLIWASNVDPSRPEISVSSSGIPPIVQTQSSPTQISLARHLTNSGAILYTAYWCSHCHDQKTLFGKEAVSELQIVECAKDGRDNQRELCDLKGITGYPSWEINGKLESGVIPLKELADISNFEGPKKDL